MTQSDPDAQRPLETPVAATPPGNDVAPPVTASADTRPHRPADDSEEVYYEGSPPVRAFEASMAIYSLLGVLFIAIPFLFRWWRGHWMPWWWLNLALVVIGIILLAIPTILAKTIRYRITNYRIDYERGLLSHDIDTLELWHVEDLHFHQSLIDRLLGVGTITVLSRDETMPQIAIRGVPNPRPLYETLKQRVIAVKRQRGVIKMDPG